MSRLTPEQATDKLIRRAQGAVTDYVAGIKAVTESPTALAAKNLDKAQLNYNNAIQSGRMAKRLNAVSREDWIKATAEKGQARYAPGLTAAKEKVLAFFTEFLPYADRVAAEIRSMPSLTIEDSVARASAAIRRLHEFERR
jgi:predicted transcriptional regulator